MLPVFIYVLLDPRTGEIRYVGQTGDPDERLQIHLRGTKQNKYYCERWIRSLRAKGVEPVMEILDVVPDNEADFWEIEYIQNFRERGAALTNIAKGGGAPMRGRKHSLETRAKMTVSQTGRKHSPEAKEKQRNAHFGLVCSPETKQKMRLAHVGRGHKKPTNNTSGFVGVHFESDRKKWAATLVHHRKLIRLGRFDDKYDAIFVRRLAENFYRA